MSLTLPPNSNLQLSTTNGDINHQGVLSCNVGKTPRLTTFPTTATSTSQGTYSNLGIDGQNNLRTDFLNVSADKEGGFQFWNSTSTQAPYNMALLNRDGLLIDHSVSNAPNLVNLPTIITGNPQYVVFTYPPSLETFGLVAGVYDNPVQVLVDVGDFKAGTTYYAQLLNAQGFSVRATPDPNDPVLDCSVFAPLIGQIIWAFVDGVQPPTISTTFLGDGLQLQTDGKNTQLDSTQISMFNTDTNSVLNLFSNRLLLSNNGEGKSVQVTPAYTNNQNQVFTAGGVNCLMRMNMDDGAPSLRLQSNTNTSVLTNSDLTFNSVSLPSSVSTNTTNITTLQIKQIYTINQNISAVIYADGRPPTAPTTTIAQQYAYTPSWYFINSFNSNNKINWYVGADTGMIVSDVLGFYLAFFNGNNTSSDNTPFITIYTTPTGSNDYAPGFYHSAITYVYNGSITANTRYTEFMNINNCPTPNHYGSTLNSMIVSPVAPNPRGDYQPSQSVAFFSIGTNSTAVKNSLEIAVSKFGVMTANGTTEVNFFPV